MFFNEIKTKLTNNHDCINIAGFANFKKLQEKSIK